MRHAKILGIALAMLVVVPLSGCWSQSWAQKEAVRMLPMAQEEVVMTAGEHYDVTVEVADVTRVGSESWLPLPAWDVSYSVLIRSREYPEFEQSTRTGFLIGPGAGELTGGIHDWPLFRTLDEWDASRRVAFLEYVAGDGNPQVEFVSSLEEGAWPGAWWSEPGEARDQALEIGRIQGMADTELAWAELWQSGELAGRLLGYDGVQQQWRLLAYRAGEFGELTVVDE